jgi:ATPase family AAA domain-containing protein 3A/B
VPDPPAPAPAACLDCLPVPPFLYLRELQIKLEEDRKRLIEAINTTFGNLGSAAAGLLTDRDKLLAAVGGLSLLALGIYSGG